MTEKNEIIVIGTLHSGWTPHSELLEILSNLKPDLLFLEISPEELDTERRKTSIRDEMFAVFDWAFDKHIPINVFDVENDILKAGVTGREKFFLHYELKSKEVLNNYSWKELNNKTPWLSPELLALNEEMNEKYIDIVKSKKREDKMLENILKGMIKGRNIVITGAGHLDFFEKKLPNAKLVLRTE